MKNSSDIVTEALKMSSSRYVAFVLIGTAIFSANEVKLQIMPQEKSLYTIVMVRHGESTANVDKVTCGWLDADLTQKGIDDAHRSAKILKDAGLTFDLVFTSLLNRAQKTVEIILKDIGQEDIPVIKDWHMNERHYGDLTGRRQDDLIDEFGEKDVLLWRRSYSVRPPPMKTTHKLYREIRLDPRYAHIPENEFPHSESLMAVIKRVSPYWKTRIVPQIREGKRILIVGHTTLLRAFVTYLEGLFQEAVLTLNIPNAVPFLYELNHRMKPIHSLKFLGDEETVAMVNKMTNLHRKDDSPMVSEGKGNLFTGEKSENEDDASSVEEGDDTSEKTEEEITEIHDGVGSTSHLRNEEPKIFSIKTTG